MTATAAPYMLDIAVTWYCMPSRNDYLDAKVRAWNRVSQADHGVGRGPGFNIHQPLRENIKQSTETVERPFSPPATDDFLQFNLARRRNYFQNLVASEMKWHGLTDCCVSQRRRPWKCVYDSCRTRAGMCDFGSRTLSFSRYLIARGTLEEMRDTVLHEIAHALAGPRHNHNRIWREIALRIGCSGERCFDGDLAPPKWWYCCSAGCWKVGRFKRSRPHDTCKQCHAKCVFVRA